MATQFLAAALVMTKLMTLKAATMSADYRGDIPQLMSLRTQASALANDRKLGYLADYWSGYAGWRVLLNGNAKTPAPDEAMAIAEQAAQAFESSIRKNATFADAYAADAAIHGLFAAYKHTDQAAMRAEIEIFQRQIRKALELEPDNPRALWVDAIPYLVLPPERGGDLDKAIGLYRQMLKNAAPLNPDSPLPDWGRVEALMSLANAHLKQSPPNIAAARSEVKQILDLQPEWHYVRDILSAQIATQEKPLHDFDYLLGDWEFTGANTQSGAVHGVWSAAQLGDGEILDEIRITSEHGTTYRTQYLRIYNFKSRQWEIVATEEGAGLQNRGTAVRDGDEIRIEQTIGTATGKPSLLKIRYYEISPDHFSWSADRSNDNGATWVTGYQQLDVKRIGPARPLTLTAERQAQH